MTLLRFYAVYRAMVRAKVAFIRARQPGLNGEETSQETQLGTAYLRLAHEFTQPRPPKLVITHGLSGSGKTTFSQELVMLFEMISLRSDIERKRLSGLEALAKSGSDVESGIYTRDFSRRTYEYLAELAEKLLQAGWSVLVDATFIACWQRDLFRKLAEGCNAPLHILDFDLPEEILRQRVQARSAEGRDASEADVFVLEQQLKTHEPLASEEKEFTIEAGSIESVVAKLMGK
jgi:hypothetical protein